MLYTYRSTTIRGALLACIAVFSVAPGFSRAAETSPPAAADGVDRGALRHDLTLTRYVGGDITIAMWLPEEFWRIVLKGSGQMTDPEIAAMVAVTHPYTLIAVVDAHKGISALRYTDADTLLKEATIEDSHGNTYHPIATDSAAEGMRSFIQMMRPTLTNMLGAMGQHVEFLVFSSLDKDGRFIADPKSDGSLTLHLGDVAMRYRLPIGSLLPPSLDPKTGESFPGSYHFNPYTGDKLVQRPSEPPAGLPPKTQ